MIMKTEIFCITLDHHIPSTQRIWTVMHFAKSKRSLQNALPDLNVPNKLFARKVIVYETAGRREIEKLGFIGTATLTYCSQN